MTKPELKKLTIACLNVAKESLGELGLDNQSLSSDNIAIATLASTILKHCLESVTSNDLRRNLQDQ